jgi:hypothetical protein
VRRHSGLFTSGASGITDRCLEFCVRRDDNQLGGLQRLGGCPFNHRGRLPNATWKAPQHKRHVLYVAALKARGIHGVLGLVGAHRCSDSHRIRCARYTVGR